MQWTLCGAGLKTDLEPVCVVRGSSLRGPPEHRMCNGICCREIDGFVFLDGRVKLVILVVAQIFLHGSSIEHVGAEIRIDGSVRFREWRGGGQRCGQRVARRSESGGKRRQRRRRGIAEGRPSGQRPGGRRRRRCSDRGSSNRSDRTCDAAATAGCAWAGSCSEACGRGEHRGGRGKQSGRRGRVEL